MGFSESLTPALQDFIRQQQLFFVATAPPMADGRINLSPKGMNTFRVLDERTFSYLDLTGSGNETAAHLRHDPKHRITVMFCSFDDNPKILRLYGTGIVLRQRDPQWKEFASKFETFANARQIIVVTINSVQTSCGFGVPRYQLLGERNNMQEWVDRKGEEGIRRYQAERNAVSIDGLETGIK